MTGPALIMGRAPNRFLDYLLRRAASSHAIAIVKLLEADPFGWVRDKYHLTHTRSQISIWVANQAYGLYLGHPAIGISERQELLSWADRRLIWMYARRFQWKSNAPREVRRAAYAAIAASSASRPAAERP